MKHLSKEEVRVLFGKNLRRFRLLNDKTQESLAEDIGLNHIQIYRIEKGMVNTSIYHLYLLSNALNIEPSDFFKEFKKSISLK